MVRIATGPVADRRDLFSETATRLGMNPAIVEKDFWVCWILKHLFAEPILKNQMVFKGGTSLSKVFGLINRFSEDIDLILDWRLLGYGRDEGNDPYQAIRDLLQWLWIDSLVLIMCLADLSGSTGNVWHPQKSARPFREGNI
jgi:hypothetical protein